MAEAQYMPDQSDVASTFLNTANATQSFMQRRQRMQWEKEDRDVQERQRQLAAPVVQSKLLADQATSLATLDTFKQQQQLRTRFAAEAPLANEEFQAAMKLPTFQEQERALALIQPKYGWMGLLPEGKGFVDTLNNSRATAFQYSLADQKIKAEMAAITARNLGAVEAIRERGSQARETAMTVGTGRPMEQKLMAAYQAAVEDGDEEGASFYRARIQRLSAPVGAPQDAARIMDLRRKAQELQATDPESAKLLLQRADYLANPRGVGSDSLDDFLGGPAPVAATTTIVAPAPAAPVAQPVPTTAIFEGIQY